MPRLLTTTLVAPIAMAALGLSLSGCGGSSTSSTASSAMSAASSAVDSASSAVSSAASSVSSAASSAASSAVASSAEAGSLAAACPEIDALMMGNPDADPAGTAKQLEAIKATVTTPDADLIEALAAAYTEIAANPNAPTEALSSSAKALGAACQTATTAPTPN